ncbi:MAG: universal stress protein [Acidimicrobiales bacterium]|nr:universal stress protein [Acidimicrobiales bacterium]
MIVVIVIVILSWLLVGFALGLYEARRGHWHWLWLLGALAGPLALPLARQIEENERLARPLDISDATGHGPGGVRLLAGIDGSDESIDAARRAANLLGSRLGDFTLAMVIDFDLHEAVPGPLSPDHPRLADERTMLESAAASLDASLGFAPATVLLSGAPADALRQQATAARFDLLAVGSRGRGMTKRLVGSCASQLAQGSPVPALIMPTHGAGAGDDEDGAAQTTPRST